MKFTPWLLSILVAASVGRAEDIDAPQGVGRPESTSETVYQRDAEGRIRVQREVRLNAHGDYVNHGVWRAWDAQGRLAGQGRYAWGKPSGQWTRWASPETPAEAFAGFTGPFLSQATYRDGKLEGVWSIFDADGRLVSEVHFQNGSRHGLATQWTPSGEIARRGRFEQGLPVGPLEVRDNGGGLLTVAQYETGREVIERAEQYDDNRPQTRETWLGGLQRLVEADDPWRLRLARFEPSGDELRHGLREAWWPNGQPKLRIEYRLGKAVGEARWWHENGQLALSGSYAEGLADGQWGWWRENGMRAAACCYRRGAAVGEWSLWAADGRRQPAAAVGRLTQRPDTMLVR